MSGTGSKILGGLGMGALFIKLCLVLSDCGRAAKFVAKGADYTMTASDVYGMGDNGEEDLREQRKKRKKKDYNPHDPVAMEAAFERIERYNDSVKLAKYQDSVKKAEKKRGKKKVSKP